MISSMISGTSDRDDEPCISSVSQPICSDVSRESPPPAACSSRLAATNSVAASSHQDSSVQEPLPGCEPCHDIGSLLNPANSITSRNQQRTLPPFLKLLHNVKPHRAQARKGQGSLEGIPHLVDAANPCVHTHMA